MPRTTVEFVSEKYISKWRLWTSLLMIFAGAVIASKFDSWYAIVGGAVLAVVGCYLNQMSIKWEMAGRPVEEG